MTECTYCGSDVYGHDPVFVMEERESATTPACRRI